MTATGLPARQRGFTLLELLVVMTLLSLLMTGLISALRTMAQTESKIDQRLARLDEIRVARAFLQQTLQRVSSAKVDAPGATGKSVIAFAATADSLRWVGIMPARPDLGGRYFFQLALEDDAAGRALVLRFSPWKPDEFFTDWAKAESRTLVQGISQLTIQAQGLVVAGSSAAQTWPVGWQSGWPVTDALPEQLNLGLVDAHGEWPTWVVPVRAMVQSDGSFSRVTVGGG